MRTWDSDFDLATPVRGGFLLCFGGHMNTARHVLPSTEFGKETFVPFCNDDDFAIHKNLTRPDVALLAFESVFSDDVADQQKETTPAGKR